MAMNLPGAKSEALVCALKSLSKHLLVSFCVVLVRYVFFFTTREFNYLPNEKLVWETIIFITLYFSASFAFNMYNKRGYLIFKEKENKTPMYVELVSFDFLFDTIGLIITVILPGFNIHIATTLIFCLIFNTAAFLFVRLLWKNGNGPSDKSLVVLRTVAFILFYSVIMCALFSLIAGLFPVMSSMKGIFNLLSYHWRTILKVVFGITIPVVILTFGSVFRKRRKFIKKLKKFCSEKNFELSEIKKPYISLFSNTLEENFTIKANGKTYSCKMMSFANKLLPVIFKENTGCYYRISSRKLKLGLKPTFSLEHFYAFKSEHQKIIILTSIPYTVMVSLGQKNKIVDSGENCGEYKLFNPTGFFGAIERNTIERKSYD